MNDLELFFDATVLLVTVSILATLQWAAVERARAHRQWTHRQRETRRTPVDWYVVLGITVGCA